MHGSVTIAVLRIALHCFSKHLFFYASFYNCPIRLRKQTNLRIFLTHLTFKRQRDYHISDLIWHFFSQEAKLFLSLSLSLSLFSLSRTHKHTHTHTLSLFLFNNSKTCFRSQWMVNCLPLLFSLITMKISFFKVENCFVLLFGMLLQ